MAEYFSKDEVRQAIFTAMDAFKHDFEPTPDEIKQAIFDKVNTVPTFDINVTDSQAAEQLLKFVQSLAKLEPDSNDCAQDWADTAGELLRNLQLPLK